MADLLLPADITSDIISRLPVETVLECKRVCKNWRSLVTSYSLFVSMHLRRQLLQFDDKIGFLFLRAEREDEVLIYKLYYGEYNENNDPESPKTLTRINHPSFYFLDSMVGSCNGLVCFLLPNHEKYMLPNQVYVCNPITREYVILPMLKKGDWIKYHMVHGFGYSRSTNEYKVVRIYYCAYSVGRIQVYTLGSGSGWRNKGEITYRLDSLSPATFINGALHWLDWKGKIFAFDLADEKFRVVPSPFCSRLLLEYYLCIFRLRILGGRLCFVLYHKHEEAIEIWSLENTKKNRNHHDMKEHEYYDDSLNWSMKFRIEGLVLFHGAYDPLGLSKDGELLLLYNGQHLCRYKPKTATLEELNENFPYSKEQLPYMKTFVSLKSLGEADVKIIKPGDQLVKER